LISSDSGAPFRLFVRAEFDDESTREAWIEWLRDVHVPDVVRCGALDAEVVRLDGDAPAAFAAYRFPSRAAYERYLATDAPALRAHAVARFPTARLTRSTGPIAV
jgi:hypothetical protein